MLKKVHGQEKSSCPVDVTMRVIGGKWKIPILFKLSSGVKRFGELRKLLTGITQKMLTTQLRELEAAGVVHREVYAVVPPKVEYSLTERGKTLQPIFQDMCKWGSEHVEHQRNGQG